MPKIDLSEFLPKKGKIFDDLLDSTPAIPQPKEVLSPPELVQLHWLKQT